MALFRRKKENIYVNKNAKRNSIHKINKFFDIINIFIFSVVLLGISTSLVVLERPTISEIENRKLAEFPKYNKESLISGTYTDSIASFFNDTVPFRNNFKNFAATIRSYLGIQMDGIKMYTVDHKKSDSFNPKTIPLPQDFSITKVTTQIPLPPQDTTQITTTTPPLETAPPIVEDPNDGGELSNNIMIYKNRGIPIYYGSLENGQVYAAYVNAYKADLGEAVNVYSMVCPTAISFYWPSYSTISHGSEPENLENIRNNLNGVQDVNVHDTLMEHKNEYIYSRTDHHWQALGAYYAAKKFAEQCNLPFADIRTYDKVVIPGYVGTLYGYSGDADLNNNPEDFTYYKPKNQYTTTYYNTAFQNPYQGNLLMDAVGSALYLTFLGGDEKITHIQTDAPNERTLAIIKDSYGNALVPFLTGSFKNIYVVDMRYFDLNSINFLRERGVTDLLFAMNTFSATGSNFQNIERIRIQ